MATATTQTNEVDEIRRSMAQIRQRLHQDMQGVVAGAEAASDWKHYVRLYPWAALGLSFAAGFLIVPRRRRSVTKTAEKAAEVAVAKVTGAVENAQAAVVSAAKSVEPTKEQTKKGLIGLAIGAVSPLILRAAQSYALSYVENWIAQQQAAAAGMGPAPGPVPPTPPPSGAATWPPGGGRRPGM